MNTANSTISSSDVTFFLYDHLGNTRVSYKSGNSTTPADIQYAGDYFPYGKILREFANGAIEKHLTTGHERDQETGLDYRGARYYDSDIGRFLSTDPLAAQYASWSTYNYVLGNPVMFIDPSGMGSEDPPKKKVHYYNVKVDADGNILSSDYMKSSSTAILKASNGSITDVWKPNGTTDIYKKFDTKGNFLGSEVVKGQGEYLSQLCQKIQAQDPNNPMNMHSGGASPCDGFWQGFIGLVGTGEFVLSKVLVSSVDDAVVNAASKTAVQATQTVAPRTISSISGHSAQQAITRGFKSTDILKIVREGNPVLAQGRYGAQWRYMLNGNTVVVNASKNRVITLFSNAPGTSNGLGAGLINPFK